MKLLTETVLFCIIYPFRCCNCSVSVESGWKTTSPNANTDVVDLVLPQTSGEQFSVWLHRSKMSNKKRKDRSSPERIDSDNEDHGSPVIERRPPNAMDTSPGRQRRDADEGYDYDEMERKRVHSGPPRPPLGGYRPRAQEVRPPSDWEGRSSTLKLHFF
jgi:hypothetical protein